MSDYFTPSGPLRGTLVPPADKSLSHRAALLGAMGTGTVRISNYLDAADTRSTLDAVRSIGASVDVNDDVVTIEGVGLRGAREPKGVVDVGNAGTLMRLLPGWLAGQSGGTWTLDGDDSIRRRPMARIVVPLRQMGATITAREDTFAPLRIDGCGLHGITYELPVASAQVKSCALLAGLLADGSTTIIEPIPSRDHTERMLLRSGVPISRKQETDGGLTESGSGMRITLSGVDRLEFTDIHIPGDPSSAAFHIAAAAIIPGSRLLIEGTAVNWTRVGFFRILERMGVRIVGELEPENAPLVGEEPIRQLEVTSGPLVGTVVEADEVPLAIDELPLVALLGCFAEGETIVRGAQELRVKESDRIENLVTGLTGLGANIEGTEDGFVVNGSGGLRGGLMRAHGDHRFAMLGAVAGLASREGVRVDGMAAAAVSYPGFVEDLNSLL